MDSNRYSLSDIDKQIIDETVADLIHMPASMREPAVQDFEAIDPELGKVLRLELSLWL